MGAPLISLYIANAIAIATIPTNSTLTVKLIAFILLVLFG
jgi:hypothetical protein